jgi:hypothetical protein
MVLASTYDQSRFLKATDITGEKKFRIKNVTEEKVGEDKEQKLCVWFTNDKRGLCLNRTNNRVLREAFGDETDGWANKIVVLFSTMTEMRGRMMPGLRVRIPLPKGDGATAQPAKPAAAKPKPAAKPVVDEDLDGDLNADIDDTKLSADDDDNDA